MPQFQNRKVKFGSSAIARTDFQDLDDADDLPDPEIPELRAALQTFSWAFGVGLDLWRPRGWAHLSGEALGWMIYIFKCRAVGLASDANQIHYFSYHPEALGRW